MATTVANIRMRQVIRAMEGVNAFSPETACDIVALGLRPRLTHKQALYYLSGRGAVVETSPGHFYIDRDALERLGRLQRRILGVCMSAIVVLLIVMLALGM